MSGDEMVKMDIRLPKGLRERFNQVCESESVNRSALVRQWIEDYVIEKEESKWVELDLLGIVWRLNKIENIKRSCADSATLLGYTSKELFSKILDMLTDKAKLNKSYREKEGIEYGKVELDDDIVYFMLDGNSSTWTTDKPDWTTNVNFN